MGSGGKRKKIKPDAMHRASPAVARLPVWIILAAVVVGAAAFARTLPYEFVYDDTHQILKNDWIRSWSNLGRFFATNVWAFTGTAIPSNYYRPLQMVAYAAAYSVGGLHPPAYHLINILLHSLCCFWVTLIGYRLSRNKWVGFTGGMLFAFHPVHVESVAWIAGIPDPLCAFFYFGALYFYADCLLSPGRRRSLLLATAFFVGALFSKEMSFTFPLAAAWLGWSLQRRLQWAHYGVFACCFAIYAAIRIAALGTFAIHQLPALSPDVQLLSTVVLFAQYLVKMFVPYGISAFHVFQPTVSLLDPAFLAGLALFAGLGTVAWKLRAHRTVLFLLGFCLITVVPVLNLTGIGENIFAERYLYIPTLGSCLLIALAIEKLGRTLPRPWFVGIRPGPVVAALVLGVFAWITQHEIGNYRNNQALYLETMRRSPDAAIIAHNLASDYCDRGDLQQAETWDNAALAGWARSFAKNRTGRAEIYSGLALIRFKQGRMREAEDYYAKAYAEAPQHDEILQNIGIFYIGTQKYEKALEFLQQAVRLNPSRVVAYTNIAGIYAMHGKWDLAIESSRQALDVNPNYGDAWANLASAYAGKGMKEEARQALLMLKKADPSKAAVAEEGLRILAR